MLQKKRLTPGQALQNIKAFCAYQDRSHSEVKDRLYSFGLNTTEVDAIISELIQEDYLNEERFARSFARGKFRMKQWGRVKIKYELKQRQVSEYCIKKGLTEIDDDEYDKTLNNLIEQKSKTLKSEKNMFVKKRKLLDYLLQKGFERDIALSAMSESK
jgi:regulatory protein